MCAQTSTPLQRPFLWKLPNLQSALGAFHEKIHFYHRTKHFPQERVWISVRQERLSLSADGRWRRLCSWSLASLAWRTWDSGLQVKPKRPFKHVTDEEEEGEDSAEPCGLKIKPASRVINKLHRRRKKHQEEPEVWHDEVKSFCGGKYFHPRVSLCIHGLVQLETLQNPMETLKPSFTFFLLLKLKDVAGGGGGPPEVSAQWWSWNDY